jgi:hypothetical protein
MGPARVMIRNKVIVMPTPNARIVSVCLRSMVISPLVESDDAETDGWI